MIVSYSEVSKWTTCQREYYYRFALNKRPMEESSPIMSGTNGHLMLETFYKALQRGCSREEARREVQNQLPKRKTPELVKVWVLVDNYINSLPLEGSAVLVEQSFIVDIEPGLKIGFTPDLLWDHKNKRLDIEDYKFVGRSWSHKKLSRYVQLDIYTVLLRKLGYSVDRAYLRFFNTETNKPSHKLYESSPARLERVFQEFIEYAHQVKAFKQLMPETQREAALRTLNINACNFCYFEYPCTLEQEGESAEKTLTTQYKENKTYGYR